MRTVINSVASPLILDEPAFVSDEQAQSAENGEQSGSEGHGNKAGSDRNHEIDVNAESAESANKKESAWNVQRNNIKKGIVAGVVQFDVSTLITMIGLWLCHSILDRQVWQQWGEHLMSGRLAASCESSLSLQ